MEPEGPLPSSQEHSEQRSRMRGAMTPPSQYVFMVWCLVQHRDKF